MKIDVIGSKYGLWTVIAEAPPLLRINGKKRPKWECQCACGKTRILDPRTLILMKSTRCHSCAKSQSRTVRHKRKIPDRNLHRSWTSRRHGMIARCEDPKNKSFSLYGARGIYVAERFRDLDYFMSFIQTLPGWDDRGLTMDRIDNNGPYVPGNIRMATAQMQAANRRSRSKAINRRN